MENLQHKKDTARNLAFATEQALMNHKRELETLTDKTLIDNMKDVIKDATETMDNAYKDFEEFEALQEAELKLGREISGDEQARSVIAAYWKSKNDAAEDKKNT